MSWHFENNRPIYLQIVEKLRGDFYSGVYEPSSKFPSVRDLAVEAHVNPNTMSKALQLLEQEGFLVSNRTSGREVTSNLEILNEKKVDNTHQILEQFLQTMEQMGYTHDQTLVQLKKYIEEKIN